MNWRICQGTFKGNRNVLHVRLWLDRGIRSKLGWQLFTDRTLYGMYRVIDYISPHGLSQCLIPVIKVKLKKRYGNTLLFFFLVRPFFVAARRVILHIYNNLSPGSLIMRAKSDPHSKILRLLD